MLFNYETIECTECGGKWITLNDAQSHVCKKFNGVNAVLAEVRAALIDIKEFGYNNPGCGFSCAKKIEQLLQNLPTLSEDRRGSDGNNE